MALCGPAALAEETEDSWGPLQSAEPEGTEGFEESVAPASTEENSISKPAQIEEVDEKVDIDLKTTAEGSASEAPSLEGVVDVDTYVNIRTGPWGQIIGGFRTGDKVKILSKEGDWFKILIGSEFAYIHSYYVDAPGFPSHQGVEPPICGSNQAPGAGGGGAGGASGGGPLLGYLQQAGLTGEELRMAWAIGMAESGGDPGAFNGDSSTGDMSYGLFQINMIGELGPERMAQYGLSCYEDLYDPATNIRVMIQMSANCSDWSPWSTYNRGNYEEYLSQFPPQ